MRVHALGSRNISAKHRNENEIDSFAGRMRWHNNQLIVFHVKCGLFAGTYPNIYYYRLKYDNVNDC